MKANRTFPTVLLFMLFTGCGTPKVWYQSGKSPDETRRDLAAARVEAARANNPLGMANGLLFIANEGNKKDLINNYMISKGYSLVDQHSLPPGAIGIPK